MATAPVLGNHPQIHPCTPIVLLLEAACMGRGSIEYVPLLEEATAVVLPLPLVV